MSVRHPPHWHTNQSHVKAALAQYGNTHRVSDVLAALQNNDNAFWLATPQSFVFAEIIDHPCKRLLNLSLAGGCLDDMLEFEQKLCAFGRVARCDESQIVGRAGWERVLPGYRRVGSLLRKTIGG